ncbi:thioredoxin-disulfide reductase [Algivirga pacifica]|uniref:Thioredoxin reductase n=1 Tax=Algivirga pacifica TaxID=1162670 RepID=A0ABP9DBL2_9BACT
MAREQVRCLIIGSGPAGYTAAIYTSRANLSPVMYQGDQPGGQLTITNDVENFPGYPEGVVGPQMMMDLQKQAERFGTDIRHGLVTKVELSKDGGKHLAIVDGKHEIEADTVIISTGASAKWLGLESEQRLNGKGVSACAVCDGFFYRGQDVVVVGGGDTAAEEATYLANICNKVYLLVRRDEMRASQIMQQRVDKAKNLEVLWNTSTVEVVGDDAVTGVKVVNNVTKEERTLDVTGFFVAIGHKPNTDIFEGQLDMDSNGYLITAADSTATNIPGVFASGDAQDHVFRQAITAAGTGCMAALEAERYLAAKEVEV